jgi:predicted phage-related endonuclease
MTIQTQKAQTDYPDRNNTATAYYHEEVETSTAGVFKRRIGSTVYSVGIHFSSTSKETVSDKIIRLVRNEADKR